MAPHSNLPSFHDSQKWMQIIGDHDKLADELILDVQERAKIKSETKSLVEVRENCVKFLEEVTHLEDVIEERIQSKRQLSSNKLEAKIIYADFKKGLHNIEIIKKKALCAIAIVDDTVKSTKETLLRRKYKQTEIEILKISLDSMKELKGMRERHLRRQLYLAKIMEKEKDQWKASLKRIDEEIALIKAERDETQRKINALKNKNRNK